MRRRVFTVEGRRQVVVIEGTKVFFGVPTRAVCVTDQLRLFVGTYTQVPADHHSLFLYPPGLEKSRYGTDILNEQDVDEYIVEAIGNLCRVRRRDLI